MKSWRILTILVLGLTVFGLVMVGSSSVVDAAKDFGDKWYYLKLQSLWALIGLVAFIFAAKFPHHRLEKLAAPLIFLTTTLLVMVLIPQFGQRLLGARRWIVLGPVNFQPSELAKVTYAIYLAALLKKAKFQSFLFSLFLISGLIILEPDLGTTIIISLMALTVYFFSRPKLTHLVILSGLLVVTVVLTVAVAPYRWARIKSFLNPASDPLGSSYQVRQALIGIGSGGITGLGLGQSRQKYQFLPEVTSDSIFAVIAEEIGILGSLGVILAFLGIGLLGTQIAKSTAHPFSHLLAIAITTTVCTQAFINISANIALLPFTGVPLPFISYGGTSLVVFLFSLGILVNIAKSNTRP